MSNVARAIRHQTGGSPGQWPCRGQQALRTARRRPRRRAYWPGTELALHEPSLRSRSRHCRRDAQHARPDRWCAEQCCGTCSRGCPDAAPIYAPIYSTAALLSVRDGRRGNFTGGCRYQPQPHCGTSTARTTRTGSRGGASKFQRRWAGRNSARNKA